MLRRSFIAGLALASAAPMAWVQARVRRTFRFDDRAVSTGWRDFTFWGESKMLFGALVNGAPEDVLLDSGVSHLVIDAAYARAMGLSVAGGFTAHGLTGSIEGGRSSDTVTIRLGTLTLTTNNVAIVDLSPVAERFGRPLNVLLGRDLFDQVMVDIDFESRKIAFHDSRRFGAPADARPVPLVPARGVRSVPIAIEGRAPTQAVFDLGMGGAIITSARYMNAEGLLEGRPRSTVMGTGVEGPVIGSSVTLSRMDFAGFQLEDIPARVHDSWSDDDRGGGAVPAYVGIEVLKRFRLIVDHPRDRLWVIPTAASVSAPFLKDRSGLGLVPREDRFEIVHVSAGGPGALAGFNAGEVIVAIDGQAVSNPNGGTARGWNHGLPGTAVALTLSDGSRRDLVLADYF